MSHYLCRLLGPRPTFPGDMTAAERDAKGVGLRYESLPMLALVSK